MTTLDPRREKFAQGVASGLSQAEAYRRANPRSLKWKDKTVWEYSSRLMAEGKVSARVKELQAEAAKNAIMTRQEWLQRMIDVADGGEDQSSRLKALVEFGRAEGFYEAEKLNVKHGGGVMVYLPDNGRTEDRG